LALCFKKEISIIKLFSNLTPTRNQQYKIGKTTTPLCPLCHSKEETISHVETCPYNPKTTTTKLNQTLVPKLRKYGSFGLFISSFIEKMTQPNYVQAKMKKDIQEKKGWTQVWHGKLLMDFSEIFTSPLKKPKTKQKVLYITMVQLIKYW
jgi:hypothetical protein